MPDITLEIFNSAVLIMVSIFVMLDKGVESNGSQHTLFLRTLLAGFLNIIVEMAACYILNNRGTYSVWYQIMIMEVYLVTLTVTMYLSVIYCLRMLNQALPPLKRVSKKAEIVVFGLIVLMNVLPLCAVKVDGANITFSKLSYGTYIIWLGFELYMLGLFGRNMHYMNMKRNNIMSLSFTARVGVIIVQLCFPHVFMLSTALMITIVALYMTLENEDVRLIEQLAVESERADEANKAKTSFVANVSHEIRTPINAILGMNEIILRETRDKTTRQYALDIKSAAQILHSIINEILDMSKIEAGRMELVPVNYNMRSLINDTVNIIQIKMDSKNLKFNVEVDSTIPAGYYGDEVRIKQIITNVLSNAVKYTNEGSVTMRISGTKLPTGRELLSFCVSDTGIGMTEENLKQLFDKFSRFDNEKNRNVEGTGLGMSITNQFLTMMGSKLNVESEYGKGSTFSFDIEQDIWDESPLGDFSKVNYKASEQYTYESSFVAAETRVLVVDDNAINRKVFKGLLKDTKLIIDEAESGPVCLNLVRKNRYDLIFMDHMMPDMDGIECFHRLKEMEDNMSINAPVIMLTANAVVGAQEDYMKEGFDDFMAKPIVPEKLEELIKKYIEV